MMKLHTYAGLSLIATLAVIYHAFNSRGQFYPVMVYLSTSKISLVLLLNMGLVIMCILWQLTKRVFLGSLREVEVERLNDQSWTEVLVILSAITIFGQDFSVTFLAMVTALLLIKALHWLAQKRVEYIETTPSVPMLSHIRIVSFLGFLLLLDSLFLYSNIKYLIETGHASVWLFFSFEYMILATTTVSTFVKHVFYVSDMLMEGQWEEKPVYTFYLEFFRDLLHLSMYLCFFVLIFMHYGVALHLIRELHETFRNFKICIADYIRYRKITSNMNDRFPDATPEELNASDATCIICHEEMSTAKKLICGHLFHVHCLRSWLERRHTCPTCKDLVVPTENGTTTAGGHGSWADVNQQASEDEDEMEPEIEYVEGYEELDIEDDIEDFGGLAIARSQMDNDNGTAMGSTSAQGSVGNGPAGDNLSQHQARLQAAAAAASIYEGTRTAMGSSSAQGSVGNGPAGDNLSQHQARLQAAAAAASIYEKSYVYPSANTLVWSPGYAVLPQVQKTPADSTNTESSGPAFIGQPQQQFAIPGGPSNLPFPQSPHCIFVPFQTPGANVTYGDRFGSNLNIPDSQLEAQKKFLSNQIEVMQNQLRLLQKPKVEENLDIGPTSSSDGKGKNVAASISSSVSDCDRHGETEVDK